MNLTKKEYLKKGIFGALFLRNILNRTDIDRLLNIYIGYQRFFSGKICLISGGSRGIGLGIAQRFAKEGNRCILVSRNENNLKSAIRSLPSSQNHEYYCLDVRNSYQWEQLAKKIDKLHVLVNAAGNAFLLSRSLSQS